MGRESHRQTRREILNVALELFSRHGYDRTSLREIAEQLGVSKAALYYHFPAKEDMLRAIIGDLLDDFEQIVRDATGAPRGTLASRTSLVGDLIDLLLKHRGTAEFLMSEKQRLDHTYYGERILRMQSVVRQALLPPEPTAEDRVRVSAALAVVWSTLDNLVDVPSIQLRQIVMKLAILALEGVRERDIAAA